MRVRLNTKNVVEEQEIQFKKSGTEVLLFEIEKFKKIVFDYGTLPNLYYVSETP